MNLKQGKNRVKQTFLWISHGQFHLLSTAAYITAALYLTGYWTFRPNLVSLLMTMAGLFIILTQQLSDAAKFSSHKPNTFTNWVKSFPTGKPTTLSADGAAFAVMAGKARVTVSIADDSSAEKKSNFFCDNMQHLIPQ